RRATAGLPGVSVPGERRLLALDVAVERRAVRSGRAKLALPALRCRGIELPEPLPRPRIEGRIESRAGALAGDADHGAHRGARTIRIEMQAIADACDAGDHPALVDEWSHVRADPR